METFLLLPTTSWFEAPEQTDSAGRPNGCRGEGFALPGLYVMVIKVRGYKLETSAFCLCLRRCLQHGRFDKPFLGQDILQDKKIRAAGICFYLGFYFFFPNVSCEHLHQRLTDDHNRRGCKGRRKHDTMRRKSGKEQLKVPYDAKFPFPVFSNKHFVDIWTALNRKVNCMRLLHSSSGC